MILELASDFKSSVNAGSSLVNGRHFHSVCLNCPSCGKPKYVEFGMVCITYICVTLTLPDEQFKCNHHKLSLTITAPLLPTQSYCTRQAFSSFIELSIINILVWRLAWVSYTTQVFLSGRLRSCF